MFIPNTISEWLEERISFIENLIKVQSNASLRNQVALHDFKYCKSLYIELCKNPNDNSTKEKFKNVANKLIFDILYEIDKQEYECRYIGGIMFPSKTKALLPQQVSDELTALRKAMSLLFDEIQDRKSVV